MRQAAGSPAEIAAKLRRLAGAFGAYARGRDLDERLKRLERLGYIERVPTRVQLVAGAMRYFATLPDTMPGAVRHLLTVKEFPTPVAA